MVVQFYGFLFIFPNQVVQLTLEFKELKSKWGSFALGGKNVLVFFFFLSWWAFLELSSSSLLTFGKFTDKIKIVIFSGSRVFLKEVLELL